MVLSRYGPRLPGLVEAALIRQTAAPVPVKRAVWPGRALWAGLGALVGAVGAGLAAFLVGM
jgi:ubiquinone biosynthesis protein